MRRTYTRALTDILYDYLLDGAAVSVEVHDDRVYCTVSGHGNEATWGTATAAHPELWGRLAHLALDVAIAAPESRNLAVRLARDAAQVAAHLAGQDEAPEPCFYPPSGDEIDHARAEAEGRPEVAT